MALRTLILLSICWMHSESTEDINEETHSRVKRQLPPKLAPDLHGYRREPLSSGEISINFINKSGRRIRMFQSSPYGHEIRFRFLLNPNEPRRVVVRPDNSFWVAYDIKTSFPMLINGQHRLETYYLRPGLNVDAQVSSQRLPPEPVKRDRSVLRFIETQVVVDDSVVLHYGRENVVDYVIVLMNMVARTYLHRSFSAPVYIAVTAINLMTDRPIYYRIVRDRPEISVRGACKYAASVKGNASVDLSLILTREDIGPSGYAPMYTMCSKRSCALVKENGPGTAFVIAHEIAHTLGIDHDEDDRCKLDNRSGGNLMVKRLFATSSNYKWSACSRRMIWENLKYFECLNNKPEMLPAFRKSMHSLPGELMNRTVQCQNFHGAAAVGCLPKLPKSRLRSFDPCRTLFCQPNPYATCQGIWFTAPLEGSVCGRGKWCKSGKCVKKVKIVPVDGGWSNYTQYSPPCGPNSNSWVIQQRNRSCTNPKPRLSGKKCKGAANEYRILLPSTSGICKPYTFRNFMLNGKIDLNNLVEEGCARMNDNKTRWRVYPESDQRQQINSLNLTCDFESKGCAWNSSSKGVKGWNIGRDKTPSRNTGPSFDHTHKGKKTGHFLYFEASWSSRSSKPLKNGDRVILISPLIMASQVCLKFAYHMYGKSINALEVFIRRGKHYRKVWSKEGEQGEDWHIAEIDLAVNIEYKISIEAVRGASYFCDIAIDDISVTHGYCGAEIKDENQHSCTTVCINEERTSMKRRQLQDGYPCQLPKSKNNVCFKKVCQSVNCHGVIGGRKC